MASFSIMHLAIFLIIVLVFVLPLWFAPTIVAVVRKHPQTVWIVLIDFFLGWTGIGWLGALIWSLLPINRQDTGTFNG